jgi:hypothetical protein
MVKLGTLFSGFKSWSNFRLMVVVGSVVTLASLGLGAVVVQAALSDDTQSEAPETESSDPSEEEAAALAEEEVTGPDTPGAAGPQPQAAAPIPVLEGNESFRISCLTGDPSRSTNTCEVESFGGFNERVTFSCAELPQNVSCSFVPASVTPRGTGKTTFRIELSAGDVPSGSYDFEVIGRSGDKVSRIRYPWGVSSAPVAVAQAPAPPPPASAPRPAPQAPAAPAGDPTFSFTCGSLSEGNKLLWSLSKDGPNVKINCFLTPLNGFNEPVTFTYAQTSELAKPNTVSFLLDQLQVRKLFDLNFEFSDAVQGLSAEQLRQGVDYVFDVTGTSATGKSLTRPVTLTVKE